APAVAHEEPAPTPVIDKEAVAQVVEEVRFYLANEMVDEARAALAKLEQLHADRTILATLNGELAAALSKPRPQPEAVEEISAVAVSALPEPEPEAEVAQSDAATHIGGLHDFVSELETSIAPDAFAQKAPEPPPLTVQPVPTVSLEGLFVPAKPAPQPTPGAVAKAPAAAVPAPITSAPAKKKELEPVNALGDFVADLERSLGDDFLPPASAAAEATAPALTPSAQPWPTSVPAAPKPEASPAPVPVPTA